MRIADTSCLYGAFIAEDAHHEKARHSLGDPDPIVIPTEIFTETLALLQRRKSFAVAHEAGAALRALPHVRIEGCSSAIEARAWSEFEKANGKLSLPDAFVVAWCKTTSAPAMSFDREITRRTEA